MLSMQSVLTLEVCLLIMSAQASSCDWRYSLKAALTASMDCLRARTRIFCLLAVCSSLCVTNFSSVSGSSLT